MYCMCVPYNRTRALKTHAYSHTHTRTQKNTRTHAKHTHTHTKSRRTHTTHTHTRTHAKTSAIVVPVPPLFARRGVWSIGEKTNKKEKIKPSASDGGIAHRSVCHPDTQRKSFSNFLHQRPWRLHVIFGLHVLSTVHQPRHNPPKQGGLLYRRC